MATPDFLEDGQTRGQELYRMGQSSPPSPNRPPAPGSGGSGGGEIAGTRAAPNGKVLGRANGYAASFLRGVPDAANLAQQMRQPAGSGGVPGPAGWSDFSNGEALDLYQRLRGTIDPEKRRQLDILAAGMQ